MIIVFLLGALVAIAGAIWIVSAQRAGEEIPGGIATLIVGIIMVVIGCMRIVPAGHVGVPVVLGKVGSSHYESGLKFVNPLTTMIKMSVRTEEYTMSSVRGDGKVAANDAINVLAKDGFRRLDEKIAKRQAEEKEAGREERERGELKRLKDKYEGDVIDDEMES